VIADSESRCWLSTLAGAVGIVVSLVTCETRGVNETAFAQLVAAEIVNNELVKQGKVAVIYADQWKRVPKNVQVAVQERLSSSGLRRIELESWQGWAGFPGTWLKKEGARYRTSQSHVLLLLEVSGSGRRRTVEWGHACGPFCGGGQIVAFEWRGGEWASKQTGVIRY
jgi:hypothetical protein